MKVSVVIPTLPKNKEYLKLCVESLRKTVDWDIIVVSNGTNETPDYSDIHGITVHLHTPSQGQCRATNIGADVVSPDTDYILVSNDDMYYAPGWNKNLRFEHLVFSPNLIEPTNNAGSAPPFLKLDAGLNVQEFDPGIVDARVHKLLELDKSETGEETGFNLPFFIKKEVWETVNGYDTVYDPWGSNSDTDLQTKIAYAGITPMRLRDVLVYHFSNKSGTFDGTHQDAWQKNWNYYTEKWGFNRDTLPTDVWYHKNVLPEDDLEIKFNANWKDKYA